MPTGARITHAGVVGGGCNRRRVIDRVGGDQDRWCGIQTRFREISALGAMGTHCVVELYDCPRKLLDDEAFVKQALVGAVACGSVELIGEVSHHFHPQGVTALGLLAESHISIHTWPENGYVAADVFTCGTQANPVKACLHLVEVFRAGRHSLIKLIRGIETPAVDDFEPPRDEPGAAVSPTSAAGAAV